MRPFSLADPSISFPFETHTKVPTPALVAIAFVVPAIIVPLVCLFCVPGPTAAHSPRALRWRRKLWEWNTGWLGLALAVCSAYLLTNGMKNLFGKPRPDLISRCKPDLGRLKENVVGGLGLENDRAALLVAHTICRDQKMIRDGFRSFPSGHASSGSFLFLLQHLDTTAPIDYTLAAVCV
jgi:membrane-associated phospholipid phosphatase